jgi:hypothetical protein
MMAKSNKADLRNKLRIVQRLLREEWDPLGVKNEPGAGDEYGSYAPAILALARDGRADDLADQLTRIEAELMQIPPNPKKNETVARLITKAILEH